MDKVNVTLVVLGAVWAAMFNVIKIVEMKNGIRNLVLDIDEKGKGISRDKKMLLIYSDFVPLSIGIFLFLLVFSGGLATIPSIYEDKKQPLSFYETAGCYATTLFTWFAMAVDLFASILEYRKMRKHIG